jgi:lipid II:glycine glycyltransferase (peptidoglycan interpeptide bridge formation enzyme)
MENIMTAGERIAFEELPPVEGTRESVLTRFPDLARPAGVLLEIDTVNEAEWYSILHQFADASFYQTWAYGAARWGAGNLSHAVLKKGDRVLAIAQLRITKMPVIGAGVAYVAWGPAWQRKGEMADVRHLAWMLQLLKLEYARKRGLLLRVVPNVMVKAAVLAGTVFNLEGFTHSPRADRTLILSLEPSLDEVRSGFRRRWRQTLAQAEKRGISTSLSLDAPSFGKALEVYHEMHERKQYEAFVDMDKLIKIQPELPAQDKMRLVLCRHNGEVVSALAWSVQGEVGLPLLSATSSKALPIDAAYLMWWEMIVWMKENGFKACDLGGINPERNPGGYMFKTGIAKTHGADVQHLGRFDYCSNLVSKVLIGTVDAARGALRKRRLNREKQRKAEDTKKAPHPEPPVLRGNDSDGSVAENQASPRPPHRQAIRSNPIRTKKVLDGADSRT